MSEDVRPEMDEHGVGLCSERCPSHDGKRCEVLGRRPDHICEPWARQVVAELRKANESGVVARLNHAIGSAEQDAPPEHGILVQLPEGWPFADVK